MVRYIWSSRRALFGWGATVQISVSGLPQEMGHQMATVISGVPAKQRTSRSGCQVRETDPSWKHQSFDRCAGHLRFGKCPSITQEYSLSGLRYLAMMLFGRPIRDHLPHYGKKLRPEWGIIFDRREEALSKRVTIPMNSKAKELQALQVGDSVQVQNQTGNHPGKWKRT